jgi:hypothetical protein
VLEADPAAALRDGDLVTAVDGVALGDWGTGPRPRSARLPPGDRLTYEVVRDGQPHAVPVVLRQADVTDRLPQAWGTILFVVALFGVVVYLYARRPGPATGALLVLGSGLLSSDLTLEIGVSALDAAGPAPLAAAGGVRHPVVLVTAWSLVALSGVGFTQWVGRVIAGETFISTATLGVGLVLAAARYRTATDPISRQQLKWLAGGACISGTLAVSVWFLPGLLLGESLLPAGWLGFSGLPVLAGLTVAVLRYRLFDVDRIISRTLANGLLTVLLGGATRWSCSAWASCSAGTPAWPWPRPSSRPAAACRPWSTGASTAATTTPLRRDAGRPTGRGRAGAGPPDRPAGHRRARPAGRDHHPQPADRRGRPLDGNGGRPRTAGPVLVQPRRRLAPRVRPDAPGPGSRPRRRPSAEATGCSP